MAMTENEKAARKAERDAEARANLLAPRAGTRPGQPATRPDLSAPPVSQGLELSEIFHKKPDWFHPDTENDADFLALKNARPAYWADLRRDIKANGILTPLLATPDGHLLQGHSRLTIARELGLAKVPVQIIESGLPQDPEARAREIRSRRRLDNLLRFEIDEDHRLAMLAEIWPEFYLAEKKAGRPAGNRDTVSPLSSTENPLTVKGFSAAENRVTVSPFSGAENPVTVKGLSAAQMAKQLGKSEKQVKRDRALAIAGATIAKAEGIDRPKPHHIAKAREEENAKRRETPKPTAKPAAATAATAAGAPADSAPASHDRSVKKAQEVGRAIAAYRSANPEADAMAYAVGRIMAAYLSDAERLALEAAMGGDQ